MSIHCIYCKRHISSEDIVGHCEICGINLCEDCDDTANDAGCNYIFKFHIDKVKCCFCTVNQTRVRNEVLDQLTHREWRQCGKNSRGDKVFDPIKLHLHKR
jgi:hypothetical protein